MLPSIFPATKDEMKRKFIFLGDMLDKMGVPLFDEATSRLVDDYFDKMPDL